MRIPVIGFAGWSGSGKTTLIERLIPELISGGSAAAGRPYHIAVIKHDVHGAKKLRHEDGTAEDAPGTDTWRFRKAGADSVVLCGPDGPDLEEALKRIYASAPDLILVEGFKSAKLPRIGVCRGANEKGLPAPPETYIAVVADTYINGAKQVPVFGFTDIAKLSRFILQFIQL